MHRSTDDPAGGTAPAGSRAHPYADGPGPGPAPDPARVDPRVLGVLLRRHGWHRRGGAQGRYSRWTPPGPAATGTSLLVPDTVTLPDSEDLLAEALTALTRSAAPSARDILVALTVPSDEIHWWRDVPEGTAGAVGWTDADRLRAAARQILLAGSLAVRGRAGYHGARHRRKARSALDGALVGSTTDGRGLTAFVPVAVGRAVAVQLYAALHAAREAVDYQRATGGMEAFDTAVAAGVSRELTEAVVALVRGRRGSGSPWPGHPPPAPRRAARPAPSPSSSRPVTCPPSGWPERATCGTNRRCRCGSRAPSCGCAARGRAARVSCGCGCWPGRRSRTSGSSSTRRPTGSRPTPIWSGFRSAWRAGWRTAAGSAVSVVPHR